MSTQEEITIAKLALAGYRFEPLARSDGSVNQYLVFTPDGMFVDSRSTRYTAALAAERHMYGTTYDGLPE